MHDLNELDRNLNLEHTPSYHISIQAGLDGFSFCIYDPANNCYLGLKHYEFQHITLLEDLLKKISSVLEQDEWINRPYKSASMMFSTRKFTLIPEELFDERYLKKLLELNVPLHEYDEIHYNKLSANGTINVFAIPYEVANLIVDLHPTVDIYHQGTPIIYHALRKEETKKGEKILIHFHEQFFDVAVIKNGHLLLYNTYEYQNENDYIYYVLNVIDQLRLDVLKYEIIFSGRVENKSKYFELTGKYFSFFRYDKVNTEILYSPALKNQIRPVFNNLYNLYHCE